MPGDEGVSGESTVAIPFFALLSATEARIQGSLGELRSTIGGLATKDDVQRLETHLLRHDTEIADLRRTDTERGADETHKRRSWGVVAAVAGGCVAACGGIGTLILALHG